MAKWEVSAEVTLFDDEQSRSKLKYENKMDIMMSDERNEPEDGQFKLDELDDFLEFGKKYKFTLMVEELP